MIAKLDLLVRFWELSARQARLGQPFFPSEQAELLSVMQLVHAEARVNCCGRGETGDEAIPAQLAGDGVMVAVEIRAISPAGLQVACTETVAVGSRVVVQAADAVSGVEYTLPCVVTWVVEGTPDLLALKVDGAPSRASFFASADTHVRSAFPFRRPQRLVG